MGLTLRDTALKKPDLPHYYEIKTFEGKKYCHCGSILDVEAILSLYPDFTYQKIYLPETPKTVNVKHIRLEDDLQIEEQKILHEPQQKPLDLI